MMYYIAVVVLGLGAVLVEHYFVEIKSWLTKLKSVDVLELLKKPFMAYEARKAEKAMTANRAWSSWKESELKTLRNLRDIDTGMIKPDTPWPRTMHMPTMPEVKPPAKLSGIRSEDIDTAKKLLDIRNTSVPKSKWGDIAVGRGANITTGNTDVFTDQVPYASQFSGVKTDDLFLLELKARYPRAGVTVTRNFTTSLPCWVIEWQNTKSKPFSCSLPLMYVTNHPHLTRGTIDYQAMLAAASAHIDKSEEVSEPI